jgi:hypothetical protein
MGKPSVFSLIPHDSGLRGKNRASMQKSQPTGEKKSNFSSEKMYMTIAPFSDKKSL